MNDTSVLAPIIAQAVATPESRSRLASAEDFLLGELERQRFNTERAIEVYKIAIDNSVWAWMKGLTSGGLMYRAYQQSGMGKKLATELTEKFKKGTGRFSPVQDQRPPRRFLRFLLGA